MFIVNLIIRFFDLMYYFAEVIIGKQLQEPILNHNLWLEVMNLVKNGVPVKLLELNGERVENSYIIRVKDQRFWFNDGREFLFGYVLNKRTRNVIPLYVSEYTKLKLEVVENPVTPGQFASFTELASTITDGGLRLNEFIFPGKEGVFKLVYDNENAPSTYRIPFFKCNTNGSVSTLFYGIDIPSMTYTDLKERWSHNGFNRSYFKPSFQ